MGQNNNPMTRPPVEPRPQQLQKVSLYLQVGPDTRASIDISGPITNQVKKALINLIGGLPASDPKISLGQVHYDDPA